MVQNLEMRLRKLLPLTVVHCFSTDVPPRMLFAFQVSSRPGYSLVCVLCSFNLWVFYVMAYRGPLGVLKLYGLSLTSDSNGKEGESAQCLLVLGRRSVPQINKFSCFSPPNGASNYWEVGELNAVWLYLGTQEKCLHLRIVVSKRFGLDILPTWTILRSCDSICAWW